MTRKGLSKNKWDAWFKLAPKSRKVADPYEYAKGRTVAEQRRTKAENAAYNNMTRQLGTVRGGTVRRGVEEMTAEQLRWTAKATARQLRRKAGIKVPPGSRNPWWYN